MNPETENRFYKLYEKLASLTQIVNKKPETEKIEALLNEISAMFRLSKGVTHFYRNPGEESRGEGETMCSYDTGREGKPVHTVRFVTRLMSITTMTVYMAEDEVPLTEEERFKVDLTMRTALAFISRNRLQVIAEDLAFYDDLGFRNTRSFFKYLTWNGQSGNLDGKAAVNYNLRHFSFINEEYGRKCGDTVLINHYKHIEQLIGDAGMAARLGGDSFVCICEQSDLPELIEYLNDAVVVADSNGKTIRISACAGVFLIPEGFTVNSPSDIMTRIMNAYTVARSGTQDNIVFFSDLLMSEHERIRKIQKIFPTALERCEFHVFYQPKVNTSTGEISGAEALCRWFHDGQIIPPMNFIPVLERSNEICKLDFYMLDLVCRDIRRWLDSGYKPIRVSVNLSRRHMTDPKLVETIMGIIDKYSVPHKCIEIELTETTTDVEFNELKSIVDELHAQNICVSVDDFGMGYSSLNLIRVVPWDVLKIDRVFLPLDGEANHSSRSIMFRYVISMAKELGLECIVEGVETRTQLELLRANGCDYAQGFFFDKPLAVEDFEKRMNAGAYPV